MPTRRADSGFAAAARIASPIRVKRKKGEPQPGPAKFLCKVRNSDCGDALIDEGLENDDMPKSGKPVEVDATVYFYGTAVTTRCSGPYKAKKDKKGSLKSDKP